MRINHLSPVNNVYTTGQPTAANVEAAASSQVQTSVGFEFGSGDSTMEDIQIEPMSEELLERSIQQANKNLAYQNRVIERVLHDVTKAVMYTVKDTVTHEVIAEFPPRRIQDMIAKMWELAGLFVDEKA